MTSEVPPSSIGSPLDEVPFVAASRGRSLLSIAVLIGACLPASFLSLKAIEFTGEIYKLPPELSGLAFGQVPPPDVQSKLDSAVFSNRLGNSVIWMGLVGAGFAFFLGGAICLVHHRKLSRLRMLLSLLVSSTIFTGLGGMLGVWIDSVSRRNMGASATSPPELSILLMHCAIWLVSGLGLGFGFVLGGGQSSRSRLELIVMIGLVSMIGGGLFPLLSGFLLPALNSSLPIPAVEPAGGRILWLCLPFLLMSVALGAHQLPASDSARPGT